MTRSIVAFLLSLTLAATAHPSEGPDPIAFCKGISLVANEIMTARQQDKPMSETLPEAIRLIKIWGANFGIEMDVDQAEEMVVGMVMAAYEKPVWTGEELSQQEVSEFENGAFKGCYEGVSSESE